MNVEVSEAADDGRLTSIGTRKVPDVESGHAFELRTNTEKSTRTKDDSLCTIAVVTHPCFWYVLVR